MNSKANIIINKLVENGYEAYYVGGCVRNFEHNKAHNDNIKIKDFDIVTNASYKDMKNLFDHIEDRGESFNVAVINIDKDEFEVASYRGERYPEGGSTRPNEIFKVETLDEDLRRRDFRMNGLVIDRDGNTLDFVGGLDDIQNKVINTIGDPNQRFSEDPLRILRAIRFACQLDYSIGIETYEGIVNNIHLLTPIPHSRIEGEFSKIIKSKNPIKGFKILKSIYDKIGSIYFTNTTLGKEVKLFESILSLPIDDFNRTISFISRSQGELSFFYSLYRSFDHEKVYKELLNMQITTKQLTNKVKLLISNKQITESPSSDNLLKLVKDIGRPNERKTLNEYLFVYKTIENIKLKELDAILKRPLFIKELSYNGQSVQEKGSRLGYLIQGKDIGRILEKGREQSVLGYKFSLRHIFALMNDTLPRKKRL